MNELEKRRYQEIFYNISKINKKLILSGVIVLAVAATCFIIKKDKVSADSISTQNTVVEESSKSVKQVTKRFWEI